MNFLDNTPNQITKFKTKNWVEINDDIGETYNKDSQMKLKTKVDYTDAYIFVNLLTGTT